MKLHPRYQQLGVTARKSSDGCVTISIPNCSVLIRWHLQTQQLFLLPRHTLTNYSRHNRGETEHVDAVEDEDGEKFVRKVDEIGLTTFSQEGGEQLKEMVDKERLEKKKPSLLAKFASHSWKLFADKRRGAREKQVDGHQYDAPDVEKNDRLKKYVRKNSNFSVQHRVQLREDLRHLHPDHRGHRHHKQLHQQQQQQQQLQQMFKQRLEKLQETRRTLQLKQKRRARSLSTINIKRTKKLGRKDQERLREKQNEKRRGKRTNGVVKDQVAEGNSRSNRQKKSHLRASPAGALPSVEIPPLLQPEISVKSLMPASASRFHARSLPVPPPPPPPPPLLINPSSVPKEIVPPSSLGIETAT